MLLSYRIWPFQKKNRSCQPTPNVTWHSEPLVTCGTGTRRRGRELPTGALCRNRQGGAAGETENGPSPAETTTGTSSSSAAPASITDPHPQPSCRSPRAGWMPTAAWMGESLTKAGGSSPRMSVGSGIKQTRIKGVQEKPVPAQLICHPPLLLL